MTSVVCLCCTATSKEISIAGASGVVVDVDTRMDPPRWATLERQLLDGASGYKTWIVDIRGTAACRSAGLQACQRPRGQP